MIEISTGDICLVSEYEKYGCWHLQNGKTGGMNTIDLHFYTETS
jgi:hypothetical protein